MDPSPRKAAPTREGLERSRDTLRWRLEASEHEIACVLDERAATEAALSKVELQLAELGPATDDESEDDDGDEGEGRVEGDWLEGSDGEDEVVDQLND